MAIAKPMARLHAVLLLVASAAGGCLADPHVEEGEAAIWYDRGPLRRLMIDGHYCEGVAVAPNVLLAAKSCFPPASTADKIFVASFDLTDYFAEATGTWTYYRGAPGETRMDGQLADLMAILVDDDVTEAPIGLAPGSLLPTPAAPMIVEVFSVRRPPVNKNQLPTARLSSDPRGNLVVEDCDADGGEILFARDPLDDSRKVIGIVTPASFGDLGLGPQPACSHLVTPVAPFTGMIEDAISSSEGHVRRITHGRTNVDGKLTGRISLTVHAQPSRLVGALFNDWGRWWGTGHISRYVDERSDISPAVHFDVSTKDFAEKPDERQVTITIRPIATVAMPPGEAGSMPQSPPAAAFRIEFSDALMGSATARIWAVAEGALLVIDFESLQTPSEWSRWSMYPFADWPSDFFDFLSVAGEDRYIPWAESPLVRLINTLERGLDLPR